MLPKSSVGSFLNTRSGESVPKKCYLQSEQVNLKGRGKKKVPSERRQRCVPRVRSRTLVAGSILDFKGFPDTTCMAQLGGIPSVECPFQRSTKELPLWWVYGVQFIEKCLDNSYAAHLKMLFYWPPVGQMVSFPTFSEISFSLRCLASQDLNSMLFANAYGACKCGEGSHQACPWTWH